MRRSEFPQHLLDLLERGPRITMWLAVVCREVVEAATALLLVWNALDWESRGQGREVGLIADGDQPRLARALL